MFRVALVDMIARDPKIGTNAGSVPPMLRELRDLHEQFIESLGNRGDTLAGGLRDIRASLRDNCKRELQVGRRDNSSVRNDDLLHAGRGSRDGARLRESVGYLAVGRDLSPVRHGRA